MRGRRQFVRHITLASAAAGLRCGGSPAAPGDPVRPPAAEPTVVRIDLMAVGATVPVFLADLELALTRLSATAVVAVSRRCTHEGCTVLLPGAPGQDLECPCHGSRYTTGGRVLNGPAVQPLRTFPARIEGAQVVITVG
jgi:Rieske Fe-S protein